MIDCSTKLEDANYTAWEDPFAPEYEIISWHIEIKPYLHNINLRHHQIISQDLWFPEDK
jgi:hypothetical protein